MRGAWRWAVVLGTIVAGVGLLTGCGSSDEVAEVPTAPGAPLADRLVTADELAIPGYAATREPVQPVDAVGSSAGDQCEARRKDTLSTLQDNQLQAAVRRSFEADGGGAVSVVSQFATPEGAEATKTAFIAQNKQDYPGCDEGITTTGYDVTSIDTPPGATLTHITQTGNGPPGDAWNVYFTDGRFLYVVGAVGPPGRVTSDQVVAAAARAWERRES